MKKTLLVLAAMLLADVALNPQSAAMAESYQDAIAKAGPTITEQPEGTLYPDLYTYGKVFFSQWGLIYDDVKDGTTRDFVIAADGSCYIKNPICSFITDSWIKGTLAKGTATGGDTITVELPQQIYTQASNEGKYYATRMIPEGDDSYVIDETTQTIKYVWRNDSLIKQEDNVLIGMTSEAGAWNGMGELTSTANVCTFTNYAPKDPSKAVRYIFSYSSTGTSVFEKMANVVFEDNYVYVNNIDADLPEAWTRGEIQGDKIVFSGPQFLGLDRANSAYKFNFPANVYYDDQETYTTVYNTLDKIEFDYDSEAKTFSCPNYGFMTNYGYRLIALQMQVFMKAGFRPWTGVEDRPQNPVVSYYDSWFMFTLSRYNVQDSFMDPSNVYYNVYYDDKKVTFTPDVYTSLSEDMTDVPIDYQDSNYDFQTYGSAHRISMYEGSVEKVGVQAFYLCNGEKLYSDLVYSDGTVVTGVKGVEDNSETIVGVSYTDLSGRPVSQPTHGIYVRTLKMKDGSTKSSKFIAR